MLDLSDIKITRRDEPVLHLLVEGCTNKEIAERKRVKLRTTLGQRQIKHIERVI